MLAPGNGRAKSTKLSIRHSATYVATLLYVISSRQQIKFGSLLVFVIVVFSVDATFSQTARPLSPERKPRKLHQRTSPLIGFIGRRRTHSYRGRRQPRGNHRTHVPDDSPHGGIRGIFPFPICPHHLKWHRSICFCSADQVHNICSPAICIHNWFFNATLLTLDRDTNIGSWPLRHSSDAASPH